MGKNVNKTIRAFVAGLSEEDARRELTLAYMQMERCQDVLRGKDVEPLKMKDNGLSSDLELFYLCRKSAEELDYLNNLVEAGDGGAQSVLLPSVGEKVYYYSGCVRESYVMTVDCAAADGIRIGLGDGTVFTDTLGIFRSEDELRENIKSVFDE